jgi:hypothetical protein
MTHYVIISPRSDGCSFLADDIHDPALDSEQAVLDAQCGAAVVYRVIDHIGREAWVCCRTRRAHPRVCRVRAVSRSHHRAGRQLAAVKPPELFRQPLRSRDQHIERFERMAIGGRVA